MVPCCRAIAQGSWALICACPTDFQPVDTVDIATMCKMKDEFDDRNCKLLAISPDTVLNHNKWVEDIEETQDVDLEFPLLADPEFTVCKLLGMVHDPPAEAAFEASEMAKVEAAATKLAKKGEIQKSLEVLANRSYGRVKAHVRTSVRCCYIVDDQKCVQAQFNYAPSLGRNFFEILRCMDGLILHAKHPAVSTPANWKYGEDVLVTAGFSDAMAMIALPKGFKTIKTYLKVTPMPVDETPVKEEESDED